MKELCTKYGKIDIWWWDAAWWNGMFTADMWDSENINRMIRKLQPGIVINNRASIPGDLDTPEQRVGMYQERPWESAITLNGLWAYSPEPNKSLKILLRELFSTAQGNGNMLLSWGALWDGHFDDAQKKLLLQMGEWLKKYGFAYYGTKGGPWMPDTKWGATYKGNKIYLYIYEWKDGRLNLPSLPHNEVINAKYVNIDAKVSYSEKNGGLQFLAPAYSDSIATIIELTMNKPVSGVMYSENNSVYNDPAYGRMINETPLFVNSWKNRQVIIDLKKVNNVTGIGLYKNNVNTKVSVSVNGKDWKEIGNAKNADKELSLSTYISGAKVLGSTMRYIKLQAVDRTGKVTVKVYAK